MSEEGRLAMKDSLQILKFSVLICVVCSTLLALASSGLKERQERNRQLNIKKNILKVVQLYSSEMDLTTEELEALYTENIRGTVIDKEGNEVKDVSPNDAKALKERGFHPIYTRVKDGQPVAYVLYVEGKGLWSTIKGYLALGEDAGTVSGVAFFDHGETPGLGGEIEKDWFTSQWSGKMIFDGNGNLVPTQVVKGKVAQSKYAKEPDYYVDGISGATLTTNGINRFIAEDLKGYEPYLRRVRKE